MLKILGPLRSRERKSTRELALAALTYIAFNWDTDRSRANSKLKPLLERYSKAELERGALNALALIMISQADVAEISVADYADKLRGVIDHELRIEP